MATNFGYHGLVIFIISFVVKDVLKDSTSEDKVISEGSPGTTVYK